MNTRLLACLLIVILLALMAFLALLCLCGGVLWWQGQQGQGPLAALLSTPTPTATATATPTQSGLGLAPTPTPTSIAAPTVTLTPTPPSVNIRLEADGSGDYATLAEAVQRAAAGATITLGPGTYRLVDPLDIFKPLHLVGAGMDETKIVSDAPDHVVFFSGDGLFAAEDIAFRYEGHTPADVVVVEGGVVSLVRCRFAGTVYERGTGERSGLRLQGNTTGVVRGCVATENNDAVGILVGDRAQPTLEGNRCVDNGTEGAGIAYYDSSGGLAHQNECSRNGTGVFVAGQSRPTLEENTCSDNELAGIAYWTNAGGVARQNECSGNGTGIFVGKQAQPTLERNLCTDSRFEGIAYHENAGGLARQNECARNGVGIYVAETANPQLIDNNCHDNRDADVRDERASARPTPVAQKVTPTRQPSSGATATQSGLGLAPTRTPESGTLPPGSYPYRQVGTVRGTDGTCKGTAWVWGYIYDIAGRPKPNVWVKVRYEGGPWGAATNTVKSGPDGIYRIQLLTGQKGTYRVTVVRSLQDPSPLSAESSPVEVTDYCQASQFQVDWREYAVAPTATQLPTATPCYPFMSEGGAQPTRPHCGQAVWAVGQIRQAEGWRIWVQVECPNGQVLRPPDAIQPDGTYRVQLPTGIYGIYKVVLVEQTYPHPYVSNLVQFSSVDPCQATEFVVNWTRRSCP